MDSAFNYNPDVPVFGYAINWEREFLQRLEWRTRVIPGDAGGEQRQCMRQYARRSFESTVFVSGPQRTAIDLMLSVRPPETIFEQRGLIYAPLWHQQIVIAETMRSSRVIYVDYPQFVYEFIADQAALVFDPVTRKFRAGAVTDFEDDGTGFYFQVDIGTEVWPTGCHVVPLKWARLAEKPQFKKLTDRLYEGAVRLDLWEPTELQFDFEGGGGEA